MMTREVLPLRARSLIALVFPSALNGYRGFKARMQAEAGRRPEITIGVDVSKDTLTLTLYPGGDSPPV